MGDFIKKILKKYLIESEINYHIGELGDNESIPSPYGSDNLFRMQGRGTGHFGSGIYFSTYRYDDNKNDFSSKYDIDNKGLTKVDDRVYRVDFDIYQNLFKVKNLSHADALFKTLKLVNSIFYSHIDYHTGDFEITNRFSIEYLKIQHNLNELGLKLPNYREFINLCKSTGRNLIDKKNIASLSTRIMEYNGFNGVNVSGIREYDNTLHGSVIYDLSKLSSEPKIVKNPDMFCRVKDDVYGDVTNQLTNILRGGKIGTYFKDISVDKQKIIIKRYNYFLSEPELSYLDNNVKDLYFKSLRYKLLNGIITKKPSIYEIQPLIDNGYIGLIYDNRITFSGETFLLYVLDNLWKFNRDTQELVIKNINRELSSDEQSAYNEIF